MRNKTVRDAVGMCALLTVIGSGCVDIFLPESKDAFDRDVNFTQTVFEPVMGHTTFYTGIFNSANSTLPLTFEIIDLMHADGTPVPELTEYYPVRVWKTPYLGTEKSIDEINAKRGTEYRRLFDVRKHTGEFIMWSEANSSVLSCQPDSGYIFNVKVSNSGGYKITKRMRLRPKREVDFEPSIYDSNTGLAIAEYVTPDLISMRYKTNELFSNMINREDVHIYFRENKDETSPSTTLTIFFYDQEWNVIHPEKFNETNFETLFRAGFLREITPNHVKYDMAYPLPLFQEANAWTNASGNRAHVRFASSSIIRGVRRAAYMELDFAIYKEAHWEMLIHFAGGMPLLGDTND
jgi:hypothetical protein